MNFYSLQKLKSLENRKTKENRSENKTISKCNFP